MVPRCVRVLVAHWLRFTERRAQSRSAAGTSRCGGLERASQLDHSVFSDIRTFLPSPSAPDRTRDARSAAVW